MNTAASAATMDCGLYLSRESFDRQMEKIKQVLLLLFRSLPAIALLLCVLAGIVLTLFPEIVPEVERHQNGAERNRGEDVVRTA